MDRKPPLKQKITRIGYRLLVWFAWASVLTFFVWSIGALYYLTTIWYPLRVILAAAYVIGAIVLFKRTPRRSTWLAWVAASILVVYATTLTQQPSNDRDWAADQVLAPEVSVSSDRNVRITNLRHSLFRSETDFDVRYRDFDFNLNELESVWFVVQKFTALEGVAHTFISFELKTPSGPQYFSVSVEVRREEGEVYSPFRGLYRQYEVIYVVGDERDVIGQRTVMRPTDRVHMYRVNATPAEVQELFLDVAKQIDKLNSQPEFYHTLLKNCTNEIVTHTYELTPKPINWLDPRLVLPGFSGKFAFSQGLVGKPGQSFTQLQQQCRIDEVAREEGLTESFSEKIRQSQR